MSLNKLEKINLLESIIINEDFASFINKKNRVLSEEEKLKLKENWFNYSSSYTRMWLSYLSDEKIDRILKKKIEQNQELIKSKDNLFSM